MRRSDAAESSSSTRGEKRPDVFCFCFYYDSISRLSIHVSKWLHSMGVLFCILTFLFWNLKTFKFQNKNFKIILTFLFFIVFYGSFILQGLNYAFNYFVVDSKVWFFFFFCLLLNLRPFRSWWVLSVLDWAPAMVIWQAWKRPTGLVLW